MTDVQELDRTQREAWKRAAGGWEKWQAPLRDNTAPVSAWLVDAIAPQPAEQVLELAAGPGETGFIAAQRLGAQGRLLSTDQSEEMVAIARRRAAELGLQNVEFEVLDAQRIPPQSNRFDAVLCRFGYMLMADPDAALRGTHGVLKPGGRLALAVWDTPDRNLWMAALPMQLVARGVIPPPDPGSPTPFSMADRTQLDQRLAQAGFKNVQTEKIEFAQSFQSFEQYWDSTCDLAAPLADAIARLDEQQLAEVRAAVRDFLGQFTAADGTIQTPASAVGAKATA